VAADRFDVAVRGGAVVTPHGVVRADIGVTAGVIAAVGERLPGALELDATDCVVLPGVIDVHVHLATTASAGFVDDVATGTRAAAAGGVTTVGHMAFPEVEGETMAAATARDLAACAADAAVDFLVHPSFALPDEYTLDDIVALARSGHRSLKTVTLFFDRGGAEMVAAFDLAGRSGMLTMVHCEDGPLIDHATHALLDAGRGSVQHYPNSRPDVTELAAVQRVIAICELTGAPVYLVHLSSARALHAARDARARGLPVYTETRPVYLELTADVHAAPDGAKYAGMPPLRTRNDVDALWRGLADGDVDTVASDHAPWALADKIDPTLDVAGVRKGIAELETMLPLLYADGVAAGRIGLTRLAAVTSTNPARLFGLYPRKGVIAVGSDADLVVLDPALSRVIDGRTMISRAGYSVYDGRETAGWPRFVIGRGEVLADAGGVRARRGHGRPLAQGPVLAPLSV
jgi:dihydropyrimidinase